MSRVLILGASGMLGNAVLRTMVQTGTHEVWGTLRNPSATRYFSPAVASRLITGVDVETADALSTLFDKITPDVVINCVGLVKQLSDGNDVLTAVPLNTLLPHRLAKHCAERNARLIHVSTDCVFSGKKGNYSESDNPDAEDVYGRSKLLGEVTDRPHAITLRTSIIGHELASAHGLADWFLAQKGRVRGYRRAIFSGLPTIELACIMRDVVLPNPTLCGLYHVAAAPITKFDLLNCIKHVYKKEIEIEPDDALVIDRSLNADKFHRATGYVAPDWQTLVARMYASNRENQCLPIVRSLLRAAPVPSGMRY
jgi:dTDP-4-dehydrorhamnose reductase